jgi:putative glutamine amidotransferase
MTDTTLPLVGLPADTYEKSGFQFHSLGDKYVRALTDVSKVLSVMIPSFINEQQINALLDHFDGVLMTGAVSNVHPPHYGEAATEAHEPYDHGRDQTTLKLIRAVIDRGIPLFCVCRGFQELNVVMGGTLETELQSAPGRLDHRGHTDDPDVRYAQVHDIAIAKGGLLERILGKSTTRVNSVHRQGVKTLGPGLEVEATAPDGIIEAVSVKGARSFAFGAQWHPEYKAAQNPDSVKLFTAFGDAVRAHARERGQVYYGAKRAV